MTDLRSRRLASLPPFIFAELDRKQKALRAAGHDVINLGIGDPDQPTPRFIVEEMAQAIRNPANHPYAYGGGTSRFRQAAASFMKRRFGVDVDPNRHVLACIGSKEGIAHLPIAVADPGDVWCVPEIHYPVYSAAAVLAGLEPHFMPMTAANGWTPDVTAIPDEIAQRARLLISNHPNNPTGSCVGVDFFEKQVQYCVEHGIIAVSDQAYSEIFFEQRPPSLWQAPSANLDQTPAIEFHSLSKTFNMTGWRIAFAVGHPEVIGALARLKTMYDSGAFAAVQQAGAHALDSSDHDDIAALRTMYRERRDALIPGLREMACEVEPPKAGFFCWARTPAGMDSWTFAERMLEQAHVVVVPGGGFSESAREWFRIALTVEVDRLRDAVGRMQRVMSDS